MTNNYSSNNDESLLKSTDPDMSGASSLSKPQKNSNEDEIDAVLNDLLNNIYPKKRRRSNTINLRSIIIPETLQDRLIYAALFFYILFILFVALLVKYQVDIFWAELLATLTVVILSLVPILLFSSVIVDIRSNWQTPREITEQRLNEIKNRFIAEQEKVERLYNLASPEKLKSFEIDIEQAIREAQAREKVSSSRSLIVAIIIVLLSIHTLEIQPQYLENNLLKASSLGIPGAVTLIAITINFMNALTLKSEIDELGKCLALLKKAQIKKDKLETYKNSDQSEQSSKKSLMWKLKQIKIDGPEDFAENLDLYLSGEKRIEPDIR